MSIPLKLVSVESFLFKSTEVAVILLVAKFVAAFGAQLSGISYVTKKPRTINSGHFFIKGLIILFSS